MPDYLKGAEYTSKVEFTDNEFPKLFIFQNQPTQINQFSNSVSLNFRFLDVAEGVNNKQRRDYEIKSDMQLAASILFDLMKKDDIILSNVDIPLQPIYIAGGDGLSGVEANVEIPLKRPCSINIPDFTINSESYTISVGGSQVVNVTDVATGDDIRFVGASTSGDIAITFNEAKTIMTLTSDGSSGLYIVNFSVTNGVRTKSSVIAVNVTAASASGIQYASYETLWSGQETSYVTGDEGWRYINGEFESYILPNPETVAVLDPDAVDPWRTLKENNVFGNKNRFTAPDGTQNYIEFNVLNYVTPMAMFIDHLYGMAIVSFYDRTQNAHQATFANAVSGGLAIDEQGYSSFSVMSLKELYQLININPSSTTLPSPFNYDPGAFNIFTSTLINGSPSYPYYLTSDGRVLWSPGQNININRGYLFVKNIQSTLQP